MQSKTSPRLVNLKNKTGVLIRNLSEGEFNNTNLSLDISIYRTRIPVCLWVLDLRPNTKYLLVPIYLRHPKSKLFPDSNKQNFKQIPKTQDH